MYRTHGYILKKIDYVVIIFIVSVVAFTRITHGFAQEGDPEPTPTAVPEISEYENRATFTFAELGQEEISLYFPSVQSFFFELPNRWNIVPSEELSYLELHYDMEDLGINDPAFLGNSQYINDLPFFEVFVNGYFADAWTPTPGENQIARIPIPFGSIKRAQNPFNEYDIRIEYARGSNCLREGDPIVVIKEDSLVRVAFGLQDPEHDLSLYPLPLVENSFIPETIYLVVPDNYSATELEAASLIAASLGSKSFGLVKVDLLTDAQASPEVLARHNAILIGNPSRNALINNLYTPGSMPTSLSANRSEIIGFGTQQILPEDGVLQLIPSNVDPDFSFLLVSGANDEALLKAAKSLAQTNLAPNLRGNLAVIKDVVETEELQVEAQTQTLEEMGFRDRTFYGIGSHEVVLTFFVPNNWVIEEDAGILLNYIHSSNLSEGNSTLTVELNGTPIGSVPVERDSTGEKAVFVPIQPEDILVGRLNRLRFNVILDVENECIQYDSRTDWMRIRNTSLLHLPHQFSAPDGELVFSDPFFYLTDDPQVSFRLPQDPSDAELDALVRFALLLGLYSEGSKIDFKVGMDSDFDPEDHEQFHLVSIGRPSTNDLFGDLNSSLPQPFLEGTDSLQQVVGTVIYRLPEDYSIGLIQAVAAPWSPLRGITAVTGTTEEGQQWAMDIITDRDLVFELAGDISYVSGLAVESVQSNEEGQKPLEFILEDLTQENATLENAETNELTPESPSTELSDAGTPTLERVSEPVDTNTIVISVLLGLGVVLVLVSLVNAFRRRAE